ncbi:MAG: beta-N-acetylhexosaminidase [Verrucomicrobia bacterium]|nr:beta-N-acetylhexosaminidase [Verrucomicrobiota bacterium]MDE3100382.1 family 20 glycosylhydrolase [Verrucomicrobiota bacterium]
MGLIETARLGTNHPVLLPPPHSLRMRPGAFTLSLKAAAWLAASRRAWAGTPPAGIRVIATPRGRRNPIRPREFYSLVISKTGVEISCSEPAGRRAALATLRQLPRQFGRRLPCLEIKDWPDFARRGVMLDISRGRVPKLKTLTELADHLADFKINELQLYTEHTFAYRRYKAVRRGWGALTAKEIQRLDAHCRAAGIDLVPNQNSFGHLRHFLEQPRLSKLAEVSAPYEEPGGKFVRRPSTLAPGHPGAMKFLRGLYDELLPNFSSRLFNVGCDEPWDLGRGRSKILCREKGAGRVYLDFLEKIHREVSRRGKTMMFWGDIILKHPKLIPKLAGNRPGLIALNWGYEAAHPFERQAAQFAKSKIPFYVCPGTSSWQTLIGRHDNALANLRRAARAGQKHGAAGFLVTDWGDGGHPQPLAVSWPMLAAGVALAWNERGLDSAALISALGRDVFGNVEIARAAYHLGFIHRKLGVSAPNETPLGTVIAAPPLRERELFCRNGLAWFSKIPPSKIRSAWAALRRQLVILADVARDNAGRRNQRSVAALELSLAARMAAESCRFMLWQRAIGAGKIRRAQPLARAGIRELQKIEKDFHAYWPLRNKAAPRHCSPFLRWRVGDYRRGFVV